MHLDCRGRPEAIVLAAKWDDVDLDAGTWTKPASTTKQKAVHQVPLSDAAMVLLKDLRRRSAPKAVWLFPTSDGQPRPDIRDAWEEIRQTANLKDARTHDLRHTYASVVVSTGQSLPIVGALLGHATPVTTAR